ncbi:hypothetical protein KLP40_06260 [Hymenobacter sp. NST-14]|uniref:hypothetical protein n=1 Tax=Hymenobacter piscis TaxID=2839984 RepID=UPI001C01BEAF|nr:hypothetical protein [Hymenobacter piscis]MBT9392761.1 hypothetical protein [Hymenobacter piscis]
MQFFFLNIISTILTIAFCAWPTPVIRAAYPISYKGGVGREIYTSLVLLGPNIYTYDEWTHAGYSVHDSGYYEMRKQRILLSSIRTVHETSNRWHRVNGRRRPLADTLTYGQLFRHSATRLDADTLIIKKRRVLYNDEFDIYLVKQIL